MPERIEREYKLWKAYDELLDAALLLCGGSDDGGLYFSPDERHAAEFVSAVEEARRQRDA